MAVLNYRTGPWFRDEGNPFGRRGVNRRKVRRAARCKAKRAEARLWDRHDH
ncbi:MAG TPA: hypothetical protein VLH10_15130 [Yinghuangia sp.]|nr:hypothetical protein [Yinghuangia sp.]